MPFSIFLDKGVKGLLSLKLVGIFTPNNCDKFFMHENIYILSKSMSSLQQDAPKIPGIGAGASVRP